MAFSPRTRGQMMALFMLVGIVILFLMGMFIFLKGATRGENIERLAIKATGASSFKEHAESCLRYETLNAVDTYGLLDGQEPYIEAAVRRSLPKCIDWDFYEQEGYDITAGELAVTATISEDALVVETDYAITGEDQTGQFALEGLDFSLPRENAAALSFDGTGRTAEETVITSTDGDAELIIPEGVRITDGDGNPVEEVAVRMLERDFNGLENPLAIGMVVYEVVPHVTFSNPVTLRVRYRDADVPSGIAEEDIRLAQFDERTGLWYSVPTEVDAEQNILDARFTSFSPATPVDRCTAEERSNRIEFPISQFEGGLVFLQDCGDETTCALGDGWKVTEEGLSELSLEADETGSLRIVTPERGEDGAFQAVGKPYNQVPLSGCSIKDWDKDDTELLAGGIETDVTGCTVDDGEDCENTVEAGVSSEELRQACRESVERYKAEHADYAARFELSAADGSTGDAMRDHAPYAAAEVSGCSCTLKAVRPSGTDEVTGGEIGSCTPVKATAPTYGYPAVEGVEDMKGLPGGFAILRFRIPGNGGGCIAKDGDGEDAKLRVEIVVSPSAGDIAEVKINPLASMDAGGELTTGQGLAAPVDELTGRPEAGFTPADGEAAALRAQWDNLEGDYGADGSGEYEVYAGGTFYNDVYIRVEDTNGDGCAQATLDSFAIYGAGISFDVPRTYERCTVTVQDRINYLCGCDTPSCTGDWGVGSELNILANWRGAWNPTAGSIVNGQTLLCDLDQNDGRLQGLMEEGWSPFGGKCGEGLMLPVAEGGECGEAGITACDYEKNAVVECSAAPSEEAASSALAGTAYVPLDGEQPDGGVQDDEQSPGNGEENTAGTEGPVWKVVRECGEEDICRIVGDAATCVGAIDIMTECNRDCREPYNVDVMGDGACYECMTVTPGGCDGSVAMAPGTWQLQPDLNPDSSPICMPYFETCVDTGGVLGIDRECRDECGAGWTPYGQGDFECTDPRYGPYCCERGADAEEGCPPGYADSDVDGRAHLLEQCQSTIGDGGFDCQGTTSISCWKDVQDAWHRCYKACEACDEQTGMCSLGVPAQEGCEGITRCEDYTAAKVDPLPDEFTWDIYCTQNPCVISESTGGCEVNGRFCQPLGSTCPPKMTRNVLYVPIAGEAGDTYYNAEPYQGGCWKCSASTGSWETSQRAADCECAGDFSPRDEPRFVNIGGGPDDRRWECKRCVVNGRPTLVDAEGCGCISGSQTFEFGDSAWKDGSCQTCSEDGWRPASNPIACPDQMCYWHTSPLSQGDTLCMGRWQDANGILRDWVATCIISASGVPNGPPSSSDNPYSVCEAGCYAGERNPVCSCAAGACPDCQMPTSTDPLYGIITTSGNEGASTLGSDGSCYLCRSEVWVTDTTACYCPSDEGGKVEWAVPGYYWVEKTTSIDQCWQCTASKTWQQETSITANEACTRHTLCGDFTYNQWRCIDNADLTNDIERCDGDNSWQNRQKCVRDCTGGEIVPPSGGDTSGSAPTWCSA